MDDQAMVDAKMMPFFFLDTGKDVKIFCPQESFKIKRKPRKSITELKKGEKSAPKSRPLKNTTQNATN
jgi:hypothetical protein